LVFGLDGHLRCSVGVFTQNVMHLMKQHGTDRLDTPDFEDRRVDIETPVTVDPHSPKTRSRDGCEGEQSGGKVRLGIGGPKSGSREVELGSGSDLCLLA
jgi:hypothetical protein